MPSMEFMLMLAQLILKTLLALYYVQAATMEKIQPSLAIPI